MPRRLLRRRRITMVRTLTIFRGIIRVIILHHLPLRLRLANLLIGSTAWVDHLHLLIIRNMIRNREVGRWDWVLGWPWELLQELGEG